jgi:hypothetical protein
MGGACSTYGGELYAWEDNIKMDLQEVRCGVMDWIELAWEGTGGGRLNEVTNLRVP